MDGMQEKEMVEKLCQIERNRYIRQLFFVKHGKNKKYHAGNGRDVKENHIVNPKEKETDHQKAGAQVFIKVLGPHPCDMEKPYQGIAHHDDRNHPEFPGHGQGEQDQHGAKHSDYAGQKKVDACLTSLSHFFSSPIAMRLRSSCGVKGFFR